MASVDHDIRSYERWLRKRRLPARKLLSLGQDDRDNVPWLFGCAKDLVRERHARCPGRTACFMTRR